MKRESKVENKNNIRNMKSSAQDEFFYCSFTVSSGDINLPEQLQSTCDENLFQKDLLKARQRTSSPINFRSLIQNSVLVDTTEFQDCPNDPLPELRGWQRSINCQKESWLKLV